LPAFGAYFARSNDGNAFVPKQRPIPGKEDANIILPALAPGAA
jgi:hypothetical protein